MIWKGKVEAKYFRRKKVELYVSLGCDLIFSNIGPDCHGHFSIMWPRAVFSAGGHDYISAGESVTFPFLKTTEGKKKIRFSSIDSYHFIQMEAIYVKKTLFIFGSRVLTTLL